MISDDFTDYERASEPENIERSSAWETAIGLQDVDGLKPSQYLVSVAKKHIDGEISFSEAKELVESYYRNQRQIETDRAEEADKVSLRIAEILTEIGFSFSPAQYLSFHSRLFHDIYPHAGKIRDFNVTKKEWVLKGDTVIYGSAPELRSTLEYDFASERGFLYTGLNMDEIIRHLARFTANLWQIHIFAEGNTRTTAVFLIKYLRSLGFPATNDSFAKHALYFRNALVRANYTNLTIGIRETTQYLELFLKNLLLDEKNELRNRTLHIDWKAE